MRRVWRDDDFLQVDVHEPRLRIRVVQRLCDRVALPLVRPLREPLPVSAEDCGGCRPARDESLRRAWLALGGYVAGADGLSADEAAELGRSAVSPECTAEQAAELLAHAAEEEGLPHEALQLAREGDAALALECLLEIARAVAVDGMSAGEWTRFCELGRALLGDAKVDALVRLAFVERERYRLRAELLA